MRSVKILFALIWAQYCIASISFHQCDTVKWVIDFEKDYPHGIFCTRLHLHLISAEEMWGETLAVWNTTAVDSFGLDIDFFTGTRYKISVPLNTVPLRFWTEYHLQLLCQSAPDSETELLAESDGFLVERGTCNPYVAIGETMKIQDISPIGLEDERKWQCAIAYEWPRKPLCIRNLV